MLTNLRENGAFYPTIRNETEATAEFTSIFENLRADRLAVPVYEAFVKLLRDQQSSNAKIETLEEFYQIYLLSLICNNFH